MVIIYFLSRYYHKCFKGITIYSFFQPANDDPAWIKQLFIDFFVENEAPVEAYTPSRSFLRLLIPMGGLCNN